MEDERDTHRESKVDVNDGRSSFNSPVLECEPLLMQIAW
jgi:hypothetical protein